MTSKKRNQIVIRTSIIGILSNIALAFIKAVIGIFTNSIAIVIDAVNNLSDVLSSTVTIIGTRLSGKSPDKEHPLGHGRLEYVSAMIIGIIIIYAGVGGLVGSIKKIVAPPEVNYDFVSLLIIAITVLVKIVLGIYVKRTGERIESLSLIASGKDALFDSLISAATLVSALLFVWKGIRVEAWIACIISMLVIKAGIKMLRETGSKIIGERLDSDLTRKIKATISAHKGVYGTHDLILHNYGNHVVIGSANIEIANNFNADQIDELTRHLKREIYSKYNVELTAIGIYAYADPKSITAKVRYDVLDIVLSNSGVMGLHGFFMDKNKKCITFDMIVGFDVKNPNEIYDQVMSSLKAKYPRYEFIITMDTDISD